MSALWWTLIKSDTQRPAALSALIERFAQRRPIRSTSLIISLFGDVVTQHGGVIWLGSLVEALGELGLDERLIRTSTFRLVKDGWLSSDRIGRRSFYSFSSSGRREYDRVAGRIYARHPAKWDGNWTLVLPLAVPDELKEPFRKTLRWQGFGVLATNVYAHPGSERAGLDDALTELDLQDAAVVMNAGTDFQHSGRLLRDVLWHNWNLEALESRYRSFVATYRPILSICDSASLSALDAFSIRQMLVHDYRRVLLHDTDLPVELLPDDWPGIEARSLAADLYRAVAKGSVQYIEQTLQSDSGLMPAVDADFWQRFSAT